MGVGVGVGVIRRPRKYILILLLAAGCAPMAEIDIQVMDPAGITLPLNVQQLAFLNRSVVPQLLHSDSTGWSEEEYYILDTIMNNRIFQGIRKSMNASPLYNLDTIEIIRVRRYDTSGIMEPLSPTRLQRFKEVHPADALLSLEYYNLKDSMSLARKFYDNYLSYDAYMGIYTTTVWRIYDLRRDIVIDEYTLQDTANWYTWDENKKIAIEQLPLMIDAIRIAAFELGTIYGNRISPGWMEVQRFYHTSGGKEMREAAGKAALTDWQGAAEIWKKLAYGENPKTAAKACFNMALVCEMEDLMIPALDWAIKSYLIRQEPLTKEYIELLKQRYENQKQLKRQLPVSTRHFEAKGTGHGNTA